MTVGSGVPPDRPTDRSMGSRAVPPVGTFTQPRRLSVVSPSVSVGLCSGSAVIDLSEHAGLHVVDETSHLVTMEEERVQREAAHRLSDIGVRVAE